MGITPGDHFRRYGLAVLALTVPFSARAEPSVASSNLVFLWIVAALACVALTWIAVSLTGRGRWLGVPKRKWVFALVLLVVLLLFVAPFIVGIGNILITGRTM